MRFGLLLAILLLGGCCRVGAGTLSATELEEERRDQAANAGPGYETIVVHPFVVVANGREVRDEAKATIEWARDHLRAEFFDKEPGKPLTILVFSDQSSYMSGTSALIGTIPDTPYGFYRPCKRTLVVNAGLGYGTLVHEMVHAYIGADFPSAPTWINEGLASLFEAPRDVDGKMHGATNWRLPGLQQAIQDHRALSFEAMASGGRSDFDGKKSGLYYATSRYLLYYLQERGLLHDFYRAYRNRGNDGHDGLTVLREITKKDTPSLHAEWTQYVATLRYELPKPL
jgi:hypothetical protein